MKRIPFIIMSLLAGGIISAHAAGAESYFFKARWGDDTMIQDGYFNNPTAVVADTSGNLYVADTDNHRIQKISSRGKFLAKWGSYGSGEGQFAFPRGIAMDASRNIYVADTGNGRIQKFTPDGKFITQWSTDGADTEPPSFPYALALDSTGNIYMTGAMSSLIRKFAPDGTFMIKWGIYGTGDGEFSSPRGIAIDSSNMIYIADTGNHRIQKFASDGTFIAKWGSQGDGNGQFDYPTGITVDDSGKVYVADTGNGRIQCFNPDGSSIDLSARYPTLDYFQGVNPPLAVAVDRSDNIYVAIYVPLVQGWIRKFAPGKPFPSYEEIGINDGFLRFRYPNSLALDANGNVYVADTGGNYITKMGPDTETGPDEMYIAQTALQGNAYPLGVALDSSGNVYVAETRNHRIQKFILNLFNGNELYMPIAAWGAFGMGDGEFQFPSSVAFDAAGDFYVADTGNGRIQKFKSDGTFVAKWGSIGTGDGQFISPAGVAVDAAGDVYVADAGNHRLQKFSNTGSFVTKWGSQGTGDGQFSAPTGVAVDSSGNVFVADKNNNRIQKFTPDGNFIMKWGSFGTGNGQFHSPTGVRVDPSGNVYVADRFNNRIQMFARLVCTYALSSASKSFRYKGGKGSVKIKPVAGTGCSWIATSNSDWIAVTPGKDSGSGKGSVAYTVAANTNPEFREGTISMAGQTLTVKQAGKPVK